MRSIVLVVLIAAAAAVPAAAQSTASPPPTQPPATPQAQTQTPVTPPTTTPQQPGQPGTATTQTTAVPAVRYFTADAGAMFSLIKPDKTADFEAVMAKVKEALGKSQDPKRKQQAQNWRVFKATEPALGGAVLYIWWLDPPIKDADYTISTLLAEAFPNEVQDLWTKYTQAFVSGQTMLNLTLTTNMNPTAATIVK